MSILRPQQAASECEGLAVHMARLKRVSSGAVADLFMAQQKTYEQRRDRFIRKYRIQCSAITPQDRPGKERT
jgi:hypothetical protein